MYRDGAGLPLSSPDIFVKVGVCASFTSAAGVKHMETTTQPDASRETLLGKRADVF